MNAFSDALKLVLESIDEAHASGIYAQSTFKGSQDEFIRQRTGWVNNLAAKVDEFAEKYGAKEKSNAKTDLLSA